MGLTMFPKKGSESPTVSCINAPKNVSGPEIYQRVRAKGFELALGYGEVRNVTFRIGNMGYIQSDDISLMLKSLDEVLKEINLKK